MRYLVILVLLAALGGCVTPKPSPESFVDAEQRIEAAVAAGAETHAPVELKFAREKLAEARYGMERKSFEKALYLVEQSEINAELAIEKSRAAELRGKVTELARQNEILREDFESTFGEDIR